MSSESEIYCVGCGIDITNALANRQALASSGATCKHIVDILMAFQENEEQAVQDVLSFGDSKMCKKCFSVCDRYSQLHDIIQDYMRKAADI